MHSCQTFILCLVAGVFMAIMLTNGFGFENRRKLTRFCYNSPQQSGLQSQCVLCEYYTFPETTLACTGSSAVNFNMSIGHAFCIINNCIRQVPQAPILLGRKKRDAELPEKEEKLDLSPSSSSSKYYTVVDEVRVYIEPYLEQEEF
ncbi:uncharacterized protein [Centruroides vittatus]|uniref:uncharacterized protein n=1 Tax=Centruroides vittatus TaxID=120091 RepID=UPI003510415A